MKKYVFVAISIKPYEDLVSSTFTVAKYYKPFIKNKIISNMNIVIQIKNQIK